MSEKEKEEFELLINRLFWRLFKFIGLPILGLAAGGVIFWAHVKDHMADGHPDTVKTLVHAQAVKSARLEEKIDSIREDVSEIKKKLIFSNSSS